MNYLNFGDGWIKKVIDPTIEFDAQGARRKNYCVAIDEESGDIYYYFRHFSGWKLENNLECFAFGEHETFLKMLGFLPVSYGKLGETGDSVNEFLKHIEIKE